MNCEWREKVALYVDDELEPAAQAEVFTHLHACPDCAATMLDQMELKKAVRMAGRRFIAPPELRATIRKSVVPSAKGRYVWQWGLIAACLVLVAALGLFVLRKTSASDPLMAEVVDQHITTLASQNPVDVISSDRHTVKPWFQGKLPFSFNLPELANTSFTLIGGRAVYLEQNPGAELLYEVGKHKISVFVLPARDGRRSSAPNGNLSFTVQSWNQDGLRFYLVTDAAKEDAVRLASMFREANRL
jgi:anti-sigma factor RsiW